MTQEINSENTNTTAINTDNAIRKWVGIVYLLQILSFAFGGITLVVGVLINYMKRAQVQGTWMESHFTWQITTFWYTFALAMAGLLTIGVIFGYILLLLSFIYLVYRVFRGWSHWNINEPIDQSIF